MLGALFAVLVLLGGAFALSRRARPQAPVEEPWRASLEDEDEEPLDLEAIRRAEEEFLAEEWDEDEDEEGDGEGDEPWR